MNKSSTTDHQKDGDEDGGAAEIISSSPDVATKDLESLDSSFSNLLNINERPSQTQTQASGSRSRGGRFNKKELGGDVAVNDSSLPLDSILSLTPKKRKERSSETQPTSAESSPKKRKECDRVYRRRSF
ncbi:unnamed protein product [Vicia faba]|uniref:Uncharacterized protein n=1 Tax=Vicia faba TaxID=3906 RepID=A0AAV0ZH41_VICFA|nr:unnamed protein product [Vicia faba]